MEAQSRARGKRFGAKRKQGWQKKKQKKPEPKWKVELREIEDVKSRYDALKSETVTTFVDIPLSKRTEDGLKLSGYAEPTEIQREAIPLALQGKDVLGAAKTGSGKTLAFLVPVLELLWRERWSQDDGLGALVISPTRELAYQTFEVLKRVGQLHDFSAGLVIGGKDVRLERERVQRTNIVVCTPGRLLQHMDETPFFECASLKVLVLDEADRILDLGFEQTMNAVIDNLPRERQSLLFSATQTKSVRDLARLSLKDPEYVAVHEHSETSTPSRLTQSYVVCELHEKLNILYSFIKSHLACKTIVFISSCKQVKHVYEAFRRLRPGVTLMSLYGRQKQLKRVGIYNDFCKKSAAVLFCTDIAARGLDFPAVHWVVQLDCPEDANMYIHRAGRTARYKEDGKALLFLLPSEEEGMLKALETKRIPVTEIRVNPKKLTSIDKKLQVFCAQDQEMKHWAQRSFICYLRSVHLQADKKVFDVHKLPIAEYATSLGLAQPPRVRFLRREEHRKAVKIRGRMETGSSQGKKDFCPGRLGDDSDSGSESDSEEVLRVKRVIMPKRVDTERGKKVQERMIVSPQQKSRKREREKEEQSVSELPHSAKLLSKVSVAKRLIHKGLKVNKHIKFDEQGHEEREETTRYPDERDEESDESLSPEAIEPVPIDQFEEVNVGKWKVGGIDIEAVQQAMKSRDKFDLQKERERIRAKHRERREKLRRQREQMMGGGARLEEEEEEVEEEESSGDDENVTSFDDGPVAKRRKRPMDSELSEEGEGEGEGLVQDEDLALHLLSAL